jgi:hypothetical protein
MIFHLDGGFDGGFTIWLDMRDRFDGICIGTGATRDQAWDAAIKNLNLLMHDAMKEAERSASPYPAVSRREAEQSVI